MSAASRKQELVEVVARLSPQGWWRMKFRRPHRNKSLSVAFDDGYRVVVTNESGNEVFNGTAWLFEACWAIGYRVRH